MNTNENTRAAGLTAAAELLEGLPEEELKHVPPWFLVKTLAMKLREMAKDEGTSNAR